MSEIESKGEGGFVPTALEKKILDTFEAFAKATRKERTFVYDPTAFSVLTKIMALYYVGPKGVSYQCMMEFDDTLESLSSASIGVGFVKDVSQVVVEKGKKGSDGPAPRAVVAVLERFMGLDAALSVLTKKRSIFLDRRAMVANFWLAEREEIPPHVRAACLLRAVRAAACLLTDRQAEGVQKDDVASKKELLSAVETLMEKALASQKAAKNVPWSQDIDKSLASVRPLVQELEVMEKPKAQAQEQVQAPLPVSRLASDGTFARRPVIISKAFFA